MVTVQDGGMRLVVGVTGASGSMFAQALLTRLERDARVAQVHLVVSPSGLRVMAEELGLAGRSGVLELLCGGTANKTHLHAWDDIGASIASGSYPVEGMVVLPCSMGTLAGIAHGMAGNLLERAADVCLKERRRLVLCVRETPLNLIHLRNMTAVTEAGATVYPVIPTFYNRPQSVEEMVGNYVDRVLQHMGLPQAGAYVWGGEK